MKWPFRKNKDSGGSEQDPLELIPPTVNLTSLKDEINLAETYVQTFERVITPNSHLPDEGLLDRATNIVNALTGSIAKCIHLLNVLKKQHFEQEQLQILDREVATYQAKVEGMRRTIIGVGKRGSFRSN